MVTGELKSKIDSVWDTLWANGFSNPISALQQLTYLLFVKLLDDNQIKREASAAALGATLKDKTFPDEGEFTVPNTELKISYRELRWSVFHHKSPDQMFDTVKNYVIPFIKNLGEGKVNAFSKYIENAVFLIDKPSVLVKVVDTIDSMDLDNKDIMGDVYEYLLDKMASNGQNGQFRTPRHIIRMIVELMKPTLDDKILDPAMGSAGFLIESAVYVENKYHDELFKKEKNDFYKNSMFNGYDNDDTMLSIGAMNLILHGVDNPNLDKRDSLSKENTDRDEYDLIMANPPFSGSLMVDDVSPDLLAITKTGKTELLFLALFTKMLKKGGRCASIVPDGVLFGSSNAHKAIRKELIDHQRLRAVISMPSGVFKPYAGVSTAILIFDKTDSGGTDKVWFYEMHADGYSLDDKREPIANNDIPDVIARFDNPEEESRTRKDQSFFVPKQEIVDNDYDLTIKKYKEIEYVKEELPEPKEILKEIKELEAEISSDLTELEKLL